jgi:hypothetical protein
MTSGSDQSIEVGIAQRSSDCGLIDVEALRVSFLEARPARHVE